MECHKYVHTLEFIRIELTFIDFLTAYLGVPIFFLLFFFWKIFKRTKWISPADADIYTGKAALDAEDAQWPELVPRNMLEKIWFWIA